MTAEEYVVKELQETKEELQLQEGHINSLRSTVNELYEKLNYVLALIEEGKTSEGIRVFNLCIWENYDKEKFDKLLELKKGDVF